MTLVVITGATRGIGRAAAIELAGRGVEVVVVGRERERVDAVAGEAQRAGGGAPVHGQVADLMLMADVRAQVSEPSDAAQDPELAAGLWERSAALVGLPADAVA